MSPLMRFCLALLCLLGPLIALLALMPLAIRAQQGAVRDSVRQERAVEAERSANLRFEISDLKTAGADGAGHLGGGD